MFSFHVTKTHTYTNRQGLSYCAPSIKIQNIIIIIISHVPTYEMEIVFQIDHKNNYILGVKCLHRVYELFSTFNTPSITYYMFAKC